MTDYQIWFACIRFEKSKTSIKLQSTAVRSLPEETTVIDTRMRNYLGFYIVMLLRYTII